MKKTLDDEFAMAALTGLMMRDDRKDWTMEHRVELAFSCAELAIAEKQKRCEHPSEERRASGGYPVCGVCGIRL